MQCRSATRSTFSTKAAHRHRCRAPPRAAASRSKFSTDAPAPVTVSSFKSIRIAMAPPTHRLLPRTTEADRFKRSSTATTTERSTSSWRIGIATGGGTFRSTTSISTAPSTSSVTIPMEKSRRLVSCTTRCMRRSNDAWPGDRACSSLHLDARLLHHPLPFHVLVGAEARELLGRVAGGSGTELDETLAECRFGRHPPDLLGDLRHHRRRRSLRRQNAFPGRHVEAGQGLRDRRNAGRRGRAFGAGHAERT